MYQIELVEDKELWKSIASNPERTSPSNVLQSWAWGQFQESLGRKIWRVGIYKTKNDGKQLVGIALAQLIPTKLRTHLYVSNGPIMNFEEDFEGLVQLNGYLKALAIQNGAKFVRIDPLIENNKKNRSLLTQSGLKIAATHTQAERKWILDIEEDEEKLLQGMDKDRRYEIRRAIKEGVKVMSSNKIEDFDKFEEVFQETVKRQGFIPHQKDYYRKQVEELLKADLYRIYWVEHKGKVIASALISFYGDTSAYLHAASINEKDSSKLYAPQSIIWQAILDGKERGIKYFDFWGIAATDDPKDPWSGFTKFKKSFGGREFNVIRGHDIPTSPTYPLIRLLEGTREIWGGIYHKIISR